MFFTAGRTPRYLWTAQTLWTPKPSHRPCWISSWPWMPLPTCTIHWFCTNLLWSSFFCRCWCFLAARSICISRFFICDTKGCVRIGIKFSSSTLEEGFGEFLAIYFVLNLKNKDDLRWKLHDSWLGRLDPNLAVWMIPNAPSCDCGALRNVFFGFTPISQKYMSPTSPTPFLIGSFVFFFVPFCTRETWIRCRFFSPLVLFSNSCFFGVCLAGDFIVLEFSCFPLWFLLWRFKHVENICWRALVNKRVDETFCEKIVAEACLRNKFNRSLLFKYNPESPRSTFEEMCLV